MVIVTCTNMYTIKDTSCMVIVTCTNTVYCKGYKLYGNSYLY